MNRDITAGAFVMSVGVLALLLVSQLPYDGDGPASASYLPRLLGWGILGVGAFITALAFRENVPMPAWHWRPIVVLVLGILAFALLIGEGGLILAAASCALIGSFAAPFTGTLRRLVTVAVITGLAVLVFKVMLDLNMRMLPSWIF